MSRTTFDDWWHLALLLALGAAALATSGGCGRSFRADDPGPADAGPAMDAGPRRDGGAAPADGGAAVCDPMEAEGLGACDLFLGWKWFGACQGVSGCECVGTDCDDLFADRAECEAAHADCALPPDCGGFRGATCDDDAWCDFPDGTCGAADGAGLCRPRPGACPEVVDPVCGCDGETYTNACFAAAAGVDVQNPRGACAR